MPEYSSTTITPADAVKVPAMNGSTSGNFQLDALRNYILASKGQANGLASLGSDGKLPLAQLPDLADDVLVYSNYATFPASGTAGKLYIAADTNKIYRWDDSLGTPAYVYLKVDWTDLTDGTVTVKKAECDASGNTITSTYETKADASDLKSAIDSNTARIENLEQEHGGLVITQYRGSNAVPSGKAKNAKVTSIVGKSRPWNQLLNKSNYGASKTENNVTFTNNGDGSITVQTTSAGASANTVFRLATSGGDSFQMLAGHKYLIAGCPNGGSDSTFMLYENYYGHKDTGSGTVFSENTSRGLVVLVRIISGVVITTPITFKPIIRDLTTILTDWASTDITTANIPLMVKQLPDLLKCDDLFANGGNGYSLVDTEVSGVESRGFNLVDTNNGTDSAYYVGHYYQEPSPNYGVSANANMNCFVVPVVPSGQYYMKKNDGTTMGTKGIVAFLDGDKNVIGGNQDGYSATSTTLNIPSDCYFIRFSVDVVASYYMQLNIYNSSLNGTVKPYVNPSTLSLPTSVILRSAGSGVNEVADSINPETGVPTTGVGVLDLSTDLTFFSTSGYWESTTAITGIKLPSTTASYPSVTHAEYLPQSYASISGSDANKNRIAITDAGKVLINNGSTTTPPSGSLRYALATSSEGSSIGTSQPMIQTESGGTINTIQIQDVEIDNCLDVAYLAL